MRADKNELGINQAEDARLRVQQMAREGRQLSFLGVPGLMSGGESMAAAEIDPAILDPTGTSVDELA